MFDNYLLGYRDRTAMLDPGRNPLVSRRGAAPLSGIIPLPSVAVFEDG
jgi:hypothetical protein